MFHWWCCMQWLICIAVKFLHCLTQRVKRSQKYWLSAPCILSCFSVDLSWFSYSPSLPSDDDDLPEISRYIPLAMLHAVAHMCCRNFFKLPMLPADAEAPENIVSWSDTDEVVREGHGFVNPCGLRPWVHMGMGTGWGLVTPTQPVPMTQAWRVLYPHMPPLSWCGSNHWAVNTDNRRAMGHSRPSYLYITCGIDDPKIYI